MLIKNKVQNNQTTTKTISTTLMRTAFNRESISDMVSWNNTTGISWMFRVIHPPDSWIRGHVGSFNNYVDQILPNYANPNMDILNTTLCHMTPRGLSTDPLTPPPNPPSSFTHSYWMTPLRYFTHLSNKDIIESNFFTSLNFQGMTNWKEHNMTSWHCEFSVRYKLKIVQKKFQTGWVQKIL